LKKGVLSAPNGYTQMRAEYKKRQRVALKHMRRGAQKMPNWIVEASNFVYRIWEPHKEGFVCFGVANRKVNSWDHFWLSAPVTLDEIQKTMLGFYPISMDIYFCPNVFRSKVRRTTCALPTSYAWADADAFIPEGYRPYPSVVIETSEGSFQCIWKFDQLLGSSDAEAISKNFVYRYGGDKNGHTVTKMLRVPFTINNKPERNGEFVKVLHFDLMPLPCPKIKVDKAKPQKSQPSGRKVENATKLTAVTIIRRYSRYLPREVQVLARETTMNTRYQDRSAVIYMIVCAFLKAGATHAEIVKILEINPYFISKHGGDTAIAWAEVERIAAKKEAGQ